MADDGKGPGHGAGPQGVGRVGKGGILGQKTITRMYGIDMIFLGNPYDFLNNQIRFQRIFVVTDLIGFISFIAVKRITVLKSKNGNCPDS